jgi:o-succinylbenzoate synthase
MNYRLRIKPYAWKFEQPLKTHHGVWEVREGLLIGLEREDGVIGWGEVAPIPWFGTETLEEAIAFFTQLPAVLTNIEISSVPNTLPACQFGLGSAHQAIYGSQYALDNCDIPCTWPPQPPNTGGRNPKSPVISPQTWGVRGASATQYCYESESELKDLTFCGLLPAGTAAFKAWKPLWQQGYRTFKWKIAVQPIEVEMKLFQHLAAALPKGAKLRLDANGGLTVKEAIQWLTLSQNTHNIQVEYLEQPLHPERFKTMAQLSRSFSTPIALDESVATLAQLKHCYQQGWTGVMVIKAAIAGYPQNLASFLTGKQIDAVFSSAFETEVGRRAALALAQAFNSKGRAVGFGITSRPSHLKTLIVGDLPPILGGWGGECSDARDS